MGKRVAVLGAGASGLAAVKSCLEEGLVPVCLERSGQLGGLWRYTDTVQEGQGCVMRSTVINTSKEMMSFSDFPIHHRRPNFMHNAQVWEYFTEYASCFELEQYIRYNVEVTLVTPAAGYDHSGKWNVSFKDLTTEEESTESFDAVLVCTGHHAEKNQPSFPGLSEFQGQVLHSHDYREPSGYTDKTMLIIGIGNSGGDLAVELSRQGQVFLSTRRGTWVLNRLDHGGLPIDIVHTRRYKIALADSLPRFLLSKVLKRRLNARLDHDMYRLRPDYSPLAQHPMVNDDLGNRIACGMVKVKGDVKRFTSTGVEFEDGSFVDGVDAVILATGYKFGFPFLDKSVVSVVNNRLPFYKYMFPPDLKHPTLAAIGCIQPLGAINPIAELQCRLAARVFKGDVKLPSASEMWEDIQSKERAMNVRYVQSPRHTIQVDYIQFMDELATLNGCKPNFCALFKQDPALAYQVYFGPCTPYQYRLLGPGKWEGARQAIMTTMDRVRCPLDTRDLPAITHQARVWGFFDRLVALVFALVLFMIFV